MTVTMKVSGNIQTEKVLDTLSDVARSFGSDKKLKTALGRYSDRIYTTMRSIADMSAGSQLGEVKAGEIYYNFLKLKPRTQIDFITGFCRSTKREVPSAIVEMEEALNTGKRKRGRQGTGRLILAEVLYADYPSMLKKEGNNRDTRAGMLITSAIRRHLEATGARRQAPKKAKVKPPDVVRLAQPLFSALYGAATDAERNVLMSVAMKAKLPSDVVSGWVASIISANVPADALADAAQVPTTTPQTPSQQARRKRSQPLAQMAA